MLSGTIVFAQSSAEMLPQKNQKIFIVSCSRQNVKLAKKELQKHNYSIADNKEDADVILDLQVERIWFNDRKAYAVFVDPKTQKDIYETRPVNTFWRFTFAPRKAVMKMLIKKRVNRYYEQTSKTA